MNAVVDFVRYRGGNIKREELERAYGANLEFKEDFDYPDEKFRSLSEKMGKIIGCVDSEEEYHRCEREFAKFLFKILLDRYGALIHRYPDLFSLLLDIEGIMERFPTLRSKKLSVLNAKPSEKVVELKYVSPNKLDHFLEQIILEFANYFGARVSLNFKSKMSEGTNETRIVVRVYPQES